MSEKLMLIDGHSILNRAFYGVPDLTNAEGIHTNAMYGFLNIMFRFLDEEQPDYFAVAFDLSAPTFRHKKYAAYKGTRKPMAEELRQQVPLIQEVLAAMNIPILTKEGYEADDILGTVAKETAAKGLEVTIISGDRDLLQLAEEHIKIRIPKTKRDGTEVEDYYAKDVIETMGVTPIEFIDMKALMGDTSDNIPGAPGIGPKTAAALITQYHTLDNIFAHLDELKPPKAKKSISENAEQIRMSRFLAEINIHAPIDFVLENAKAEGYFTPEAYEYIKRFNFKSFFKRFDMIETKKEFEAESYFAVTSDLSEAEQMFEKAQQRVKQGAWLGLSVAYEQGVLYGVSLAFSEKEVIFVAADGFLNEAYLKEKTAKLVSVCESPKLVVMNLKNFLDIFRETPENSNNTKLHASEKAFYDLAIAAYLVNPNTEHYTYDTLAQEYLGVTLPAKTELFGKADMKTIWQETPEHIYKMANYESVTSLLCWSSVATKMEEQNMMQLFSEIEMPLVFVLYEMQAEGIRVDAEALSNYGRMLGEKLTVLEKEIYAEAGEEFNINSPKQLGVILFEKLGMPNGKKTKSGYSTAADVLDKLAPDYPIVRKILEYRQVAKLKSTYADGLVTYIRADGRIHGTFNQTITATGRISSTEPNLQNIPIRMELGKKIRQVFIPKEGYVFLDADYSQIELRILAHMSKDAKLIEAYNSEQDIHRMTASQVFHVPFEEVTEQQRRNAKAVNFGIVYGISSFGLSQDLSISRKEADGYIKKYFETYPSIKQFLDNLVITAKKNGYSLTMYNRRRPIPELRSGNFMQRSFGERVAMNAPIQGTAADIIKLAMIHVYQELQKRNLRSHLILQVHDELLVETHKDEIEEVKHIMVDCMKHAADLLVALEVDIKEGKDWLEAH